MEQGNKTKSNTTALMCAFVRAYHHLHAAVKVYDDPLAFEILGKATYEMIAANLQSGVDFFCPGFKGTPEAALDIIVNTILAPSVLGRAAYAETALYAAVKNGCERCLQLGVGYDTFTLRLPEWAKRIKYIAADFETVIEDRGNRIKKAGIIHPDNVTDLALDINSPDLPDLIKGIGAASAVFVSILGVSYYLSQDELSHMLNSLGFLPKGSMIVLDYPSKDYESIGGSHQSRLASAAGEKMLSSYTAEDISRLASHNGLHIDENLDDSEINRRFFSSTGLHAQNNVYYACLVK